VATPILHVPPSLLKTIADSAERAYPREACGLVVGTVGADGTLRATAALESANLAPADQPDRFEIDPALRLRVQREARERGERVLGHWHSHPDGAARPSAMDLSLAWERDLVWLVVQVVEGQAVRINAHRLADDGSRFEPVALADGEGPAPRRAPTPLDDLGRVGGREA
jgi:proteasome lid subunit RPN8/RPN11